MSLNFFTYEDLSDWIVEGGTFAYKYVLGTDKNNTDNRIACIEKTPRIQIVRGFGWSEKDTSYMQNDGSIKSFWMYGGKGSDCFDETSRDWCDRVLKAVYEDDNGI